MPVKPSGELIVNGFGRQCVFPPVGRCIYCGKARGHLGDEHIIPQSLGGNLILPKASCRECEGEIGGRLEGRITNKHNGMFAAMRLRLAFRSKRPKERPKFLFFEVVDKLGVSRREAIPAELVPRHWITFVTQGPPGIYTGADPRGEAQVAVVTQYDQSDMDRLGRFYTSINLQGANDARDLARFLAKIAHGMAVAEYGLDSFKPLLPNFILGRDETSFHYFVSGSNDSNPETKGVHRISMATWDNDGRRLCALIRLFCRYAAPEYTVAVGDLIEPLHQIPMP